MMPDIPAASAEGGTSAWVRADVATLEEFW
jgi:hypothetical protein